MGKPQGADKKGGKSISLAQTCVVYLSFLERTSSWSVCKTVRQEVEEGDSDVGVYSLSCSHGTQRDLIRHRNRPLLICKSVCKKPQNNPFYSITAEFSIFFLTVLTGRNSECAELCALIQGNQPKSYSNDEKFLF